MKESPAHPTAKLIACSLFVFLFSAVTAYYRTFVSMATYDDEGTMMWSVKRFFEGGPLYDRWPLFTARCTTSINGAPTS